MIARACAFTRLLASAVAHEVSGQVGESRLRPQKMRAIPCTHFLGLRPLSASAPGISRPRSISFLFSFFCTPGQTCYTIPTRQFTGQAKRKKKKSHSHLTVPHARRDAFAHVWDCDSENETQRIGRPFSESESASRRPRCRTSQRVK